MLYACLTIKKEKKRWIGYFEKLAYRFFSCFVHYVAHLVILFKCLFLFFTRILVLYKSVRFHILNHSDSKYITEVHHFKCVIGFLSWHYSIHSQRSIHLPFPFNELYFTWFRDDRHENAANRFHQIYNLKIEELCFFVFNLLTKVAFFSADGNISFFSWVAKFQHELNTNTTHTQKNDHMKEKISLLISWL